MSNISNTKKYAVKWMNHCGDDISKISYELKISKDKVKEILGQSDDTEHVANESSKKSLTSKDLMIRQTAGKGANSVAIMTKEASEVSDTHRTKQQSSGNDFEKGIFRPNK